MVFVRRLYLASIFLVLAAHVAHAQTPGILILDSNQLYAQSAYAQSLREQINKDRIALEAEFAEIISGLELEEKQLAEARQTLSPQDFAAAASAFDQKVQQVRSEQDERVRASDRALRSQRDLFFGRITPVILKVIEERGAAVILEKAQVLLARSQFDVTAEVITRVDTQFLSPELLPEN